MSNEAAQHAMPTTDDSNMSVSYSNFCRIIGTPEELIIDFGLNPQPVGDLSAPIPMTQRVVTSFYTAKRMLAALHATVQRHEAVFGHIELDAMKRRVSQGE